MTSADLFLPNSPPLATIPNFSHLLTAYSSIPAPEQLKHITNLRDRAYTHHPYPCLGRFRFLELDLTLHPLYNAVVLPLLKSTTPPVFLDLGCCLGQDVRKLLFDLGPKADGESRGNVYGADLKPEFIDIGYQLFLDEAKLPRTQFIAPADVFDDSEGNALSVLDGEVGVLNCSAVFHLFGLAKQKLVARRCLRLLRREGLEGEGKKVLVLGCQTANMNAGEYARANGTLRVRHNEESWRKMWEDVVGGEEWRDVVEKVEVESQLLAVDERMERLKGGEAQAAAEQQSAAATDREAETAEEKKVETADEKKAGPRSAWLEEGFRWQTWSVWVTFK